MATSRTCGPEFPVTAAGVAPIRIGLVGFGRAGRAVAVATLRGRGVVLEWVARRDPSDSVSACEVLGIRARSSGTIVSAGATRATDLLDRRPVDAIVDFSSSSGIDYYGDAAAERGVAIVCAVSSFERDPHPRLRRWARSAPVLWSPNITLGVNFLLLAATALREIEPEADVAIIEEHFRDKAETSGTALRLAEHLGIGPEHVRSIRAGDIIGNHEIVFGLAHQTVRLRHESITREAFGDGALFAARQLAGRPPGVYRMEDLLLDRMSKARARLPADPPPSGG